jgi:hypothetical protein
MSSLRSAATLLSHTRSFRDLTPLAGRLGFSEPVLLDGRSRSALGIDGSARRVAVASGAGTVRALVVELAPSTTARESIARIAARVSQASPELLWLVVAVQPATGTIVIAAPAPGAATRIAALALDARRVMDSDAETVAAMADAGGAIDVLVHQRWRELLGRDALTRRFYRELERVVLDLSASARGGGSERDRRELALLCVSRLLFLSFLEAKGWLDGDREFLRHAFDARCERGGAVHRRLLDPLFFGTLNTPVPKRAAAARSLGRIPFLNGGLFARTPTEKRHHNLAFSDEALGAMIGGLLGRYRVTAREDSTSWSESAVDPEMLGRAFESLMAPDDRRSSGAFYTPPAIIERVAGEGLAMALQARGLPAEILPAIAAGQSVRAKDRGRLRAALTGLRILDPACGSGAFLVYLLERLAALASSGGDTRASGVVRRELLTESIFGVDVNPTAVWLCELRLWLSVVIDSAERDPLRVVPLPNLDRHIRVGDALAGDTFDDTIRITAPAVLARLRSRYSRATGARKHTLSRALDREERRLAVDVASRAGDIIAAKRRDLLCTFRSRDLFAERPVMSTPQKRELESLRRAAAAARKRITALRSGGPLAFSFPVHFADAQANGGFDLVVGNPPWVRLHNIPAAQRESLRSRFRSFRDAAWAAGAAETGAGRGFAAQVDLAALFTERSLALSRSGGVTALLLPAKLWRSLAGGGVRQLVADESRVIALEDWAESRSAFDAAVYPSMLIALRRDAPENASAAKSGAQEHTARMAVHHRDATLKWNAPFVSVPLDVSRGAPWLLLPPEARAGFDRLVAAGPPLSRTSFGRPLLGVKTGCNDAFVFSDRDDHVEPRLLRPVLRGESARAWRASAGGGSILWTHDADDRPLAQLPPRAAEWLAPWRRRLDARTDAKSGARWWALFRTESARADCPRVVWSDIGKSPRALVLPAGDRTVPLNSCYVSRAPSINDAFAFCALLNSPLVAAWLAVIAEPARGGYHRYLGWTLSRLPMPANWPRAVELLAPVGRAAHDGAPPDAATLTDIVIRAYRVRYASTAALMTWCLR